MAIELSEYWQEWVRDEALHAGVSEEELVEDALKYFQQSLVKANEAAIAKAYETVESGHRVEEFKISFPKPSQDQTYWRVPGLGIFDLEGNLLTQIS